ncbi:DoxX family protein [Terrimonas ferruginea]|uniref:DoxX family protein n=1 Tax=Terrimonas ferruginea TaxID=249 RepID=UPI000AC5566C|nr:DoxX family protein [Terrimonas ferruginea]
MKIEKRNRLIYWIATAWLALGMLSTAIVQLLHHQQELDSITHLGYPAYLLTIIGAWKILGVIAVLVPGFLLLKEWAYAGFFFVMSGAVVSHIIMNDSFKEIGPGLLLIALTVLSWYFRPPNRRIATNSN